MVGVGEEGRTARRVAKADGRPQGAHPHPQLGPAPAPQHCSATARLRRPRMTARHCRRVHRTAAENGRWTPTGLSCGTQRLQVVTVRSSVGCGAVDDRPMCPVCTFARLSAAAQQRQQRSLRRPSRAHDTSTSSARPLPSLSVRSTLLPYRHGQPLSSAVPVDGHLFCTQQLSLPSHRAAFQLQLQTPLLRPFPPSALAPLLPLPSYPLLPPPPHPFRPPLRYPPPLPRPPHRPPPPPLHPRTTPPPSSPSSSTSSADAFALVLTAATSIIEASPTPHSLVLSLLPHPSLARRRGDRIDLPYVVLTALTSSPLPCPPPSPPPP